MGEFKREFRYLVLKFKDANEHLSETEKRQLALLAGKVDAGRAEAGKMPLECVVVESDWPEYEPTWAAIEARMMPQPQRCPDCGGVKPEHQCNILKYLKMIIDEDSPHGPQMLRD